MIFNLANYKTIKTPDHCEFEPWLDVDTITSDNPTSECIYRVETRNF